MGVCCGKLASKFTSSKSSSNFTTEYGSENGYTDGIILDVPNLRIYTFEELKTMTKNFKIETPMSHRELGRSYKGWVEEKTLNPAAATDELALVVCVRKMEFFEKNNIGKWRYMVNFLGRLSHPNLVKLVGYCWKDEEFYWVHEYMQKTSLENLLFITHYPLSWSLRLKILIDIARGLCFLHNLEKNVIYRDLKPSNILIDSNFNAKLSDFSLALHGPSAGESYVDEEVMGTYGYVAPEYVATGQINVKIDVYSFGAVFMEILTGLRSFDRNRPHWQHNLVEWARPKLPEVFDHKLKGQYQSEEAFQAAKLCLKCLSTDQKLRPSMKEIVETLENIEAAQNMPRKS